MNEEGRVPDGRWTTPYAELGGTHSLSGPALARIAREVLARGHAFRFLAPGTSMSPFILDGDVITLVPFASACSLGDIVAYVPPDSGRLVVHRVVSVGSDRCRIQGDNSLKEDGVFPFESILGVVARVERAGRSIRFGLGPERTLIAMLSRRRWLPGCVKAARAVKSTLRRFS
jgi:hypothetical protein